jgi:acetyl-CoA carboxylase biotin carboxyl carrier protein
VEGRAPEQVVTACAHDSGAGRSVMASPAQPAMTGAPAVPGIVPVSAPVAEPPKANEENDAGLHVITSPIVGTFYRAPNPESSPFVAIGDRISKGQVLCIIEAMKLMNEIEADVEGVIAKVYPQNGQPIEYGEKLFAVRIS